MYLLITGILATGCRLVVKQFLKSAAYMITYTNLLYN